MLLNMAGGGASKEFPEFTYTGSYQFLDDGNKNWRIKFLTSGTLTFTKLGSAKNGIDVFLVGGGGCGIWAMPGAGGYTFTNKHIIPNATTNYSIVIGAGSTSDTGQGGTSSAFGSSAKGGYSGKHATYPGTGGTGAPRAYNNMGSSDGANGAGASGNAGKGQGTTTREFGESGGTLYAGSGATTTSATTTYYGGAGGGGNVEGGNAMAGAANTGGGGAGSGAGTDKIQAANGGSGIVIIRNAR